MIRGVVRRLNAVSSVPFGLIAAIALTAAVERTIIHGNPAIQNPHGVSWSYAARLSNKKYMANRDVLCFGDSLVKYGLAPKVIERETGRRGFNLAVFGGTAPSSYFLLRRALESGARPSTVIVNFSHDRLTLPPGSPEHRIPWADLVNLRESVELCRAARDPGLFARITLARSVPSVKQRYEIRARVLKAFQGRMVAAGDFSVWLTGNWNRNDGAYLASKMRFAHEPLPSRTAPSLGNWKCEPTNAAYIHKFLDLAARHRARVYWLWPPLTPTAQKFAEISGTEEGAENFIRDLIRRHDNLVFIDGRHAGYENSVFVDQIHLDLDGLRALSAGVSEVLRQPPSDPRPESRWVALPAFRPPSIDDPLKADRPSSLARRTRFPSQKSQR